MKPHSWIGEGAASSRAAAPGWLGRRAKGYYRDVRAHAFLLGGLWLASACSGAPLASGPDGAAGQAGAGDAPVEATADAGAADVLQHETPPGCPPALASPSELASTPRADVNLELLALKLSPGKVVAPQATYDRVVRDVGAIRAKAPELAKIMFFSFNDGRRIELTVPVETGTQMQAGTYHAWDCLNETYGASLPAEIIRIGNADQEYVWLTLKGIYAAHLLAAEYARLPGVTSTEGRAFGGDGPTICATADGSTWHYVFDDASGDCPAGCIDHAYRHFSTDAAGVVTELERWSTKDGTPRPAWVTQLASNESCH
jgi:hypothetical protein